MKEKQFDHIENRIRAAAENSEPDFDEQAWQKMELLLDKENDRRRPAAWFIVPVMLCAMVAGYFIFGKTKSVQAVPSVTEQHSTASKTGLTQIPVTANISIKENNISENNKTAVATRNNSDLSTGGDVSKNNKTGAVSIPIKLISYQATDDNNKTGNRDENVFGQIVKSKRSVKGKAKIAIRSSAASENTDEGIISLTEETKKIIPAAETIENDTAITKKETVKTIVKKDTLVKNKVTTETTAENSGGHKPSKFYFLASVGAEASSVKFLSTANSTTVAKYGLGVGYQLNKRLSVQTGFNISHKKYIAGAGDYNPKAGSYWAMVEIRKVDANCLVYELPLAVRYNFLQKNKLSFFATAGISSFIMKREDYQYDYIRDYTNHQGSWTYTGNKNFFSIVSLSAGVEKKIGSGFSLLAEPSLSIPVSGVGDGKVKLYSMGLQVGLKYQPFRKK